MNYLLILFFIIIILIIKYYCRLGCFQLVCKKYPRVPKCAQAVHLHVQEVLKIVYSMCTALYIILAHGVHFQRVSNVVHSDCPKLDTACIHVFTT